MVVKSQTFQVNNHLLCEAKALAQQGIPIAVDFDSTLALTDGYPNIVGVNGNCFEILHKWQNIGCKIILNTMRHTKDLEQAVVWCSNCGFFFDSINCNPENDTRDPTPCNKVYAMFYIDDRALGVPLKHDTSDVIKDHVDWDEIDTIYTPLIEELIEKLHN